MCFLSAAGIVAVASVVVGVMITLVWPDQPWNATADHTDQPAAGRVMGGAASAVELLEQSPGIAAVGIATMGILCTMLVGRLFGPSLAATAPPTPLKPTARRQAGTGSGH